jgi:hypothetical protein
MLQELGFTENNIAELLGEWKSEDEVWGDLIRAMRLELKARLEDIMEAEWALLDSKSTIAIVLILQTGEQSPIEFGIIVR